MTVFNIEYVVMYLKADKRVVRCCVHNSVTELQIHGDCSLEETLKGHVTKMG